MCISIYYRYIASTSHTHTHTHTLTHSHRERESVMERAPLPMLQKYTADDILALLFTIYTYILVLIYTIYTITQYKSILEYTSIQYKVILEYYIDVYSSINIYYIYYYLHSITLYDIYKSAGVVSYTHTHTHTANRCCVSAVCCILFVQQTLYTRAQAVHAIYSMSYTTTLYSMLCTVTLYAVRSIVLRLYDYDYTRAQASYLHIISRVVRLYCAFYSNTIYTIILERRLYI